MSRLETSIPLYRDVKQTAIVQLFPLVTMLYLYKKSHFCFVFSLHRHVFCLVPPTVNFSEKKNYRQLDCHSLLLLA